MRIKDFRKGWGAAGGSAADEILGEEEALMPMEFSTNVRSGP
jgi:hypothetical protein